MRGLSVSVLQHSLRVLIDDNSGMRAMSGQRNAESAQVGREARSIPVAGKRMDDHHRFPFKPLGLVRGADQDPGHVGEPSRDRAGLFDMRSNNGNVAGLEWGVLSVCMEQKATGDELANALGG